MLNRLHGRIFQEETLLTLLVRRRNHSFNRVVDANRDTILNILRGYLSTIHLPTRSITNQDLHLRRTGRTILRSMRLEELLTTEP